MKLYNTLSQQLEPFQTQGKAVTLYGCGVTPYDTTHLGHAFTYVVVDLLVRALETQGYTVKYVQNVTDVDDDILRKAASAGEDWQSLGNRWTTHFIQDLQALHVRPPDHLPRASAVIAPIIRQVEQLLQAGVAYVAGASVYFAVKAWPAFGKLSHLPSAEMLSVANERGNQPDDPNKRDPLDFVLWQAQQPGEPAWPSPWGPGRPGWHIECSTLVQELLGPTIDLHAGGTDLIFPHHECEIAQAEAATDHQPFVRYWLHTAMVQHEGEKMSKSLGNLILVRELLERYSSDALRLYLANYHYRQSWAYDEAVLKRAASLAAKLQDAANVVPVRSRTAQRQALDAKPLARFFWQALEHDLDTPRAVAALLQLADRILQAATQGKGVEQAQATLRQLVAICGLRLGVEPEERVVAGWNAHLHQFANGAPPPPAAVQASTPALTVA